MVLRKWLWLLLVCLLGLTGSVTVSAQEAEYQDTLLEAEGLRNPGAVSDGSRDTYTSCSEGSSVTVSRSDGIGAIYIEFDRIPQEWTLTDPVSGESVSCGQNAFLHEYVDVAALFDRLPETLVLEFPADTAVADIYGFSEGELPDWVQVWEPPCTEADLLLISSHSDDEQLFFAGILPLYAGERGLNVQVAYVVQHFEANGVQDHKRPHEQLDGLWTVGVRNYPVMSDFPDLYAESKDRDTAFAQASAVYENVGISYDDFVDYITTCLRRFRPLVVVSHDLNGEYGHGTHVLCSAALTEAIRYAAEEEKYPESAAQYGTWQVEKTYLHLYGENVIEMNYDEPLEHFGGKTAFEVTREGFDCHKSQHWTWFYKWIYGTDGNPITKASDISRYSPCLFGLYDSQVGLDVTGGDFMENVVTYGERAIIAEQEAEAARAEAERIAAEEAAQKAKEEAERIAAEEAAQKAAEEAERKAAEEAAQAEEAARETQAKKKRWILAGGIGVTVGALGVAWILFHGNRRK